MANAYRYSFLPEVPIEELSDTLHLARIACESLYGETQVRLETAFDLNLKKRILMLKADTSIGRAMNRLFIGFTTTEFGPDSFRVERCDWPQVNRRSKTLV